MISLQFIYISTVQVSLYFNLKFQSDGARELILYRIIKLLCLNSFFFFFHSLKKLRSNSILMCHAFQKFYGFNVMKHKISSCFFE